MALCPGQRGQPPRGRGPPRWSRGASRAGPGQALVVEDAFHLVLEAAGLDGAVHPALLGRVLLPPPAPGARVLAGLGGAGAGAAADGGVALGVQRVGGDVVLAQVVPNLVLGPVRQRVELDDPTVVVVQLDLADVGA